MLRSIAAVLAAAVPATACGAADAGEVEPERYATSVCSRLATWRDGILADSAGLTGSLGKASDVATVRAHYTRFFSGTVRRTDQLLGAVRDAGAPKADHGLGYARDLAAGTYTDSGLNRAFRDEPACQRLSGT